MGLRQIKTRLVHTFNFYCVDLNQKCFHVAPFFSSFLQALIVSTLPCGFPSMLFRACQGFAKELLMLKGTTNPGTCSVTQLPLGQVQTSGSVVINLTLSLILSKILVARISNAHYNHTIWSVLTLVPCIFDITVVSFVLKLFVLSCIYISFTLMGFITLFKIFYFQAHIIF